MCLLVLAERDRCDDGGGVQLQRDVLGRVVGVGGPAGRLVGRLVVQDVVRLVGGREAREVVDLVGQLLPLHRLQQRRRRGSVSDMAKLREILPPHICPMSIICHQPTSSVLVSIGSIFKLIATNARLPPPP